MTDETITDALTARVIEVAADVALAPVLGSICEAYRILFTDEIDDKVLIGQVRTHLRIAFRAITGMPDDSSDDTHYAMWNYGFPL